MDSPLPLPQPLLRSPLLERLLDAPFTFTERPVPTPAELRPQWRTTLVCLIVDACWGKRASWHQLHVLNWATRSPVTRATYERLHQLQARPDDVVVRYDPSLDRAIDLALGERFLERKGGDIVALTARGKGVVARLSGEDALVEEKRFLGQVRPVTQAFVEQLLARSGA